MTPLMAETEKVLIRRLGPEEAGKFHRKVFPSGSFYDVMWGDKSPEEMADEMIDVYDSLEGMDEAGSRDVINLIDVVGRVNRMFEEDDAEMERLKREYAKERLSEPLSVSLRYAAGVRPLEEAAERAFAGALTEAAVEDSAEWDGGGGGRVYGTVMTDIVPAGDDDYVTVPLHGADFEDISSVDVYGFAVAGR